MGHATSVPAERESVSPRSLRPLLATMHMLGCDVAGWLRASNLTLAQITDASARLTAAVVIDAWEKADAIAGVPDLGVRAASLIDVRLVAYMGADDDLLVLRSVVARATLGEALRTVVRTNRVVAPAVHYRLTDPALGPGLVVVPPGRTNSLAFQTFFPAYVVWLLRCATGRKIVPRALQLACPPRTELAAVTSWFGVAPTFGEDTRFVLDPGDLALPIATASSANARLVDDVVAARLLQLAEGDVVRRVHATIEARLASGLPSAGDVARELGMSARTLARRLDDEGTNFRTLVDDVRASVAVRLTDEGRCSSVEVARRAGFSDERSLRRALRRWRARATVGESGAEDGSLGP